jgi:putative PEP-CTERM system histidine kinase
LGKEITGAVYNYEDYDILKTLCHQAANAIMNIKLSERLVLTRELEILNKISSFVFHDLKNSISMLSLIVQNASCNMNNPEFQRDLLETISKAINNMEQLMVRISKFPKEIVLNKTKVDLTALLKDTIAKMGLRNNSIKLSENYADLPKINLDQDKIQSVVRNLILNAQESMKDNGKITISTFLEDDHIIIEVKDNGPGITKEFLRNNLFKPFQTTKKRGLGIGLYQCKIIVAAHAGKIEVASEEGQGARFRIFLPIEKENKKNE